VVGYYCDWIYYYYDRRPLDTTTLKLKIKGIKKETFCSQYMTGGLLRWLERQVCLYSYPGGLLLVEFWHNTP